jgi:two-component system, NtrC family, response regulator AtoC
MDPEQIPLNQTTEETSAAEPQNGQNAGDQWLELARLARTIERLAGMVGRSEKMLELFKTVTRLGPHKSTVLIQGESGTGKELVARALHLFGPAPKGPFITFNCSNLVDTLAESQLFGHVRGAFTDARETSLGYFRSANGGTLFLDEIGELPLRLQSKLLRVVETHEIQPVGSTQSHKVDIRLVAATNCDLRSMVKSGHFRDDLYYRLNTALILIPPLRERRDDVPSLAAHFIAHYNQMLGKQVRYIARSALEALLRYDWPGNVRELSHTIESAMLMTDSDRIDASDLPAHLTVGGASLDAASLQAERMVDDTLPGNGKRESVNGEDYPLFSLDRAMREAAREALVRALNKTDGNCIRAARLLGVSRYTVYRMISRFGLEDIRGGRGSSARVSARSAGEGQR